MSQKMFHNLVQIIINTWKNGDDLVVLSIIWGVERVSLKIVKSTSFGLGK